jgi:carbonic anhydrase
MKSLDIQILNSLKKDIPASIVVFLVALPLCLGVALASGAPLISGIISGVIGGIVVGWISNSSTSVSGPAAGLTAVVAGAILELGSYEIFLLAVIIAGLFQIVSGFAKTGFIADYIPSNTIKGLLAAIGIILILKQIPHALGYDKDPEGDFSFYQPDKENTFSELLNIADYFSFGAPTISILSIVLLIYWNKFHFRKYIPAPLLVVILGIIANAIFDNWIPKFYLSASHLVSIPTIENFNSLLTFPDFSSITRPDVWFVGATIGIVASLETLLNIEALEKLDTEKRKSSPNKELIAQGIGNSISGLLGGLPITSVIVRSSVNISAGANTKLSTILHGVFLLLFVLFASALLNMIPLASLAAILIVTGYKLANVSLFKEMYAKGWDQFIPFVGTILAIVFTDLLIGILIGLAISIFFLLKSNLKNPFVLKKEKAYTEETYNLELSNQVTFLNKAGIKNFLWNLPHGAKVTIDATQSDFIDNDVLEIMDEFKTKVSKDKWIRLNILGIKSKYELNDQIDYIDFLSKETMSQLEPNEIVDLLKEGNKRFVNGTGRKKYYKQQVEAGSSDGQNPMAVIISCIDSRTSPEIIFDVGLGDLLSIRIAGNIINDDILGSIELACQDLGAKVVLVLGHSECGAIGKAIKGKGQGHVFNITQKIEKAIAECNCDRHSLLEDNVAFNNVVRQNMKNSFKDILSQSKFLKEAKESGKVGVYSAYYDLKTGIVDFG